MIFTRPWRDWSGLDLSILQARRLEDDKALGGDESGEAMAADENFIAFARKRLQRDGPNL